MDTDESTWHYPNMVARTPEQAVHVRRLRETAIVFTLFVVPGLTSSAPLSHLVGGVAPLVALTIRNVAFALLVLYLLDIQGDQQIIHRHVSEGTAFPLFVVLRVWGALLLISLLVSLISAAVGSGVAPVGTESVVPALNDRYHPMVWVPLLVVAMVSVGIVEELLFRGYFIGRIRQLGQPAPRAVVASALLFSVGHGYQGPAALVFSFLAGVTLGTLWVIRPHLGAFALGHAAYNISALALTVWYT